MTREKENPLHVLVAHEDAESRREIRKSLSAESVQPHGRTFVHSTKRKRATRRPSPYRLTMLEPRSSLIDEIYRSDPDVVLLSDGTCRNIVELGEILGEIRDLFPRVSIILTSEDMPPPSALCSAMKNNGVSMLLGKRNLSNEHLVRGAIELVYLKEGQ